jgi:hypothetical protein
VLAWAVICLSVAAIGLAMASVLNTRTIGRLMVRVSALERGCHGVSDVADHHWWIDARGRVRTDRGRMGRQS